MVFRKFLVRIFARVVFTCPVSTAGLARAPASVPARAGADQAPAPANKNLTPVYHPVDKRTGGGGHCVSDNVPIMIVTTAL